MWRNRPHSESDSAIFTGIDQVSIATRDLDATLSHLTNDLGIGPFKCWTLRPPELLERSFRGGAGQWSMRLAMGLLGPTQIEVIAPLEGPSLFTEHLERTGASVHHIMLENRGRSLEDVVAEMAKRGLPWVQDGRVNVPLLLGGVTIPAAPSFLTAHLTTHFGYLDSVGELGTTLELAAFPPGVSRMLGARISKAESWFPAGATDVTATLGNALFDRVVKVGLVVRSLERSVRAWIERTGIGPWFVSELGPKDLGAVQVGGEPADFEARVAWALLGSMLIELVEPIRGNSPHGRILEQRGEGIHAIGMRSDAYELDALVAHVGARGLKETMGGTLYGGYRFALLEGPFTGIEVLELDAAPLYESLKRLPGVRRVPPS